MFECEEEKENVSQAKSIKAFVQSNMFVVHFGCCRHFVLSKPLGLSYQVRYYESDSEINQIIYLLCDVSRRFDFIIISSRATSK
jgi:hypothetical protein